MSEQASQVHLTEPEVTAESLGATAGAALPATSPDELFKDWCRKHGLQAAKCDDINIWIRYAFEGGMAAGGIAASPDLYAAAECASNVLFLLEEEVKRLGHRAGNVKEKLDAALAKARGQA